MKATVKGTTEQGKDFVTELEFILHEPDGNRRYGTGCYMSVEFILTGDEMTVDVRYEKTTCIEELAKRWIDNYFGENARQLTFH